MAYTSDSGGEGLFLSRLADLCGRAAAQNAPCTMGFLNDRQQALCKERLPYDGTHYRLYGGYEEAERCYLCVSPFSEIPDDAFPIRCVELAHRKQDILAHKDFLGSILGLGLRRECVGDIVVTPGQALCFLSSAAADTVLRELGQVGRVGVDCREVFGAGVREPRSYEPVEGTVASLRLDCIVAFLDRSSRSRAAEMIAQKLVAVDGVLREGSRVIQAGEKISIRGRGKFLFEGILGVSKKDRLRVRFLKYV